MRFFLAALVLICASVSAQETPTKGPARDSNPEVSRPKTYEGCVVRSDNRLLLKDSAGKEYILVRNARSLGTEASAGESQSLESYAGQKVRVRADTVDPGDPSLDDRGVNSETPQHRPPTLNVENIAKAGGRCSTAE